MRDGRHTLIIESGDITFRIQESTWSNFFM